MKHGLYLLAFALACVLPSDSWAITSPARATAATSSAPPAETVVAEVASRRGAKRHRRELRRESRAARRADPGARRELNGLAIAGFVISIAGLPLLGFIASILGLVFGIVALSKIKKYDQRGKGFAIAAIVLGGLGVLILGVVVAALLSGGFFIA